MIPILVLSLFVSALVVFFAFVPIRTSWFFKEDDGYTGRKQIRPKKKKKVVYKNMFSMDDEDDDYDDPEL
ncbi:MAG: hypothetical protein FWE16_01125 [Firmicutes bacterium]|nr:hypothetical protein [Bacillota bacterium]